MMKMTEREYDFLKNDDCSSTGGTPSPTLRRTNIPLVVLREGVVPVLRGQVYQYWKNFITLYNPESEQNPILSKN